MNNELLNEVAFAVKVAMLKRKMKPIELQRETGLTRSVIFKVLGGQAVTFGSLTRVLDVLELKLKVDGL